MKTFILAAIIVIFSGVLTSCHKMNFKKLKTTAAVVTNFSNVANSLATAD